MSLCLVGLGTCAEAGTAQEMPLLVETQVRLLEVIFDFDRTHEHRAVDGLVVAVLYQSRYRQSLLAREAFEEAALRHITTPEGTELTLVALDVSDPEGLSAALAENEVDIVYVTPLRALDLSRVTDVTRVYGALSCTGVPEYVGQGVSVGLGVQDGTPKILINRETAEAEGASFSSQLLGMARLVEEGP